MTRMPELPEVETIKNQLDEALHGAVIEEIRVTDKLAGRVTGAVRGKVVRSVERVGKAIVFRLGNGGPSPKGELSVAVHLRMSGRLLWSDPDEKSRAQFRFRNCSRVLNFMDTRRLGKIFVIDGVDPRRFLGTGPDPTSQDLTPEEFHGMLKRRKAMIKPLLLNQGFLSGVGNIYATEALFLAGIRPSRRARSLGKTESFRLLASLREVLKAGLKSGGCSLKDYVDIYGRPGRMQRQLRVYGKRDGEPCPRCEGPLRFVVLGARGTVFCPSCQG